VLNPPSKSGTSVEESYEEARQAMMMRISGGVRFRAVQRGLERFRTAEPTV
jgi:hypothetical protein